MRRVLGFLSPVVVAAACGGTPSPAPLVVQDRDASTAPVATGSAAGKPLPDAPTPEVAALRSCAARGDDSTVKEALASARKLAAQGPVTDRALVDAVWTCFDRFRPSQAKSINLVKDLADTVMAVKDASYGPKAVAKIAAPVNDPKDPAESMDQIQFWQAISNLALRLRARTL